jgi:hypothetical protein
LIIEGGYTMARFLIEVPHEPQGAACARAVQTFLQSGSHFLMNADWGCMDGEHKAWIILEVDDKEQARAVLPPRFRSDAKITGLNKFKMKEMEAMLRSHLA